MLYCHKIPYYWAGVFVLEAARFLCPAFALIDNAPVTLLEVQDRTPAGASTAPVG